METIEANNTTLPVIMISWGGGGGGGGGGENFQSEVHHRCIHLW
jgi:hypothetical protein